MANKFVLVPREIYRGLLESSSLSSNNIDLLERTPLLRAQQELLQQQQQTKSSRKKGAAAIGARNTLYQQKLRSYLRLRKEASAKPIKVKLQNGVHLFMRPNEDSGVFEKTLGQQQGEEQQPEFNAIFQSPENAEEWADAVYGAETSAPPAAASFAQPATTSTRTPIASVRQRKKILKSGAVKGSMENEIIEDLYKHVTENASRFGLTPDGSKILSAQTQRPIKQSDTKSSLESIVRRIPGSPVGTTQLRYKLEKDPTFKQLMSGLQAGQGKHIAHEKQQHKRKIAPFSSAVFRPVKWTK